MSPSERWRELLTGPEEHLRLDEAALLISAHANPRLVLDEQLQRLDELAGRVGEPDIDRLCRLLFTNLQFRGDVMTYGDPRNSYLDQVLDRRLGIPISLSVLLIEVGRRCGLELEGVGMPGHFLVRDRGTPELLIDAFTDGRRLDAADCEQIYRSFAGSGTPFRQEMLAGIGPRAILARMLANLERIFKDRVDRRSLLWVTRLRVEIPDLPFGQRVRLANRLDRMGCYREAATLFDELASDPSHTDETVRQLTIRATNVRSHLN